MKKRAYSPQKNRSYSASASRSFYFISFHSGIGGNLFRSRRLTNWLGHQTARARPFCLALNGMTILVTLHPDPSPHVRSSPPATQEVGFANTTLGPSPSFYADPGPGLAFWEARSHRAHGPAGLPAVVGILPFPGQRLGWMRDLLHEERYGRR